MLLNTVILAQSKLDSVQVLNEVTVFGERYREVIPSQRLSGEKLKTLSSFSVADAIRYFSGVQIKDYGGIGGLKTVDIRSMGTNHLGVFYDGIQLGNAQNGQIDLGKFSLDNIEEISLYNGQKSEIFQSAKDFGSAGTIYLRTRRPQFEGDKKFNIATYFRTGSFDLVNPSVLWEQKINKNVSSSLNAEYIYASGKYPFRYRKKQNGVVMWDTTAVRQNGDINSLRLEGSLNGNLQDGYWRAKTYFYNSEKGIPGAIVNNEWRRPERQWDRNFFAQGTFQKTMFKNDDLLLNIKYANDWLRYLSNDTVKWDETQTALKTYHADNRFKQQEIYTSIANKYSILSNWNTNISADYQWNTLDASVLNGQKLTDAYRHTLLVAMATAFEYKRLKGQASILGTFVWDNADTQDIDTTGIVKQKSHLSADKQEFTPAVFVSYQPFKRYNLNFRTFYKHIFRMPTMNDLYYVDIGNIKLCPEYTTQYNIGFQYDKYLRKRFLNYLNVRTDVYYNEVTNKIVAIPKGSGQYRWMMMNLGYVEIRGVDVTVQTGWKLPADIQLNTSLNYTFQKVQDFTIYEKESEMQGYSGQIPYIPWHNGSAIVNILWKTFDFNYSFIYVGERYWNSVNIIEYYIQPWYTHDLTIGKTTSLPLTHSKRGGNTSPKEQVGMRLKISAEINNILNQYYDVVLNYPMPGRNFKIILKLEI